MQKKIIMEIYKGDRIYLKEINLKDLDQTVMEWFNDDELMKYYTNSRNKITREKLVSSIEEGKKTGNLFTFGIYTNELNNLIGTIKIGPINLNHKISDLVALIGDRNYLGKGISVEAIKLGNKIAFEKFNIRKLYGGMYASNIASIKAYTKAGWIIEGRLKGFYLVDNKNEDRILVSCFNPKFFLETEIKQIKENERRYTSN
jgi:ribosomal-protein-alanine N-acetyltransferase